MGERNPVALAGLAGFSGAGGGKNRRNTDKLCFSARVRSVIKLPMQTIATGSRPVITNRHLAANEWRSSGTPPVVF
jgi:hypothetical protein